MNRTPFIRPPFNPDMDLIVRRAFQGGGKRYEGGETFPWQQLAVNERRVRQLYDAGYLMDRSHQAASDPFPKDPETPEQPDDELAELPMKELREIADREGAPKKVSKVDQAAAIRANRSKAA